MDEYDIYVPTVNAEGQSFASGTLDDIKKGIIDRFGGLTDTRHKNKGFWKAGGAVIRDELVIWRVISDEGEAGEEYMRGVQAALEKLLQQDKILVVKRRIEFL